MILMGPDQNITSTDVTDHIYLLKLKKSAPVVLPVPLREMLSSLAYRSTMFWMLLSLNRDATAWLGLSVAERSSVRTLRLDGEETSRKTAPCPSTQRLREISNEEENTYRQRCQGCTPTYTNFVQLLNATSVRPLRTQCGKCLLCPPF